VRNGETLSITIHPVSPPGDPVEPIVVENAHYVSYMNAESYGKPAILTEAKHDGEGDLKVVYVMTQNTVAVEVETHGRA
jgi:hypothetical protein